MKKNLYIIIASVLFSIIIWISIALSDDYYTTLNLPINIIDFPDGYATASRIPNEVSLRIKGDGWKLLGIELGSQEFFQVSANRDSGMISVNLLNSLEDNPWISSGMLLLDISPKNIRFVVEPTVRKKVQVIPDITLNFKEGFGLAHEITISPDSVVILGPKSAIAKTENFKTKSITLNELDKKIKLNLELETERGFYALQRFVTADVDVQRIVEKTFSNIPVKISNIPNDRDLVLIPQFINCTLRGGINVLGKMDEGLISASINYLDVVRDTLGSVIPVINVPKNLQLISIKPERLKYIIKKFE